MQLVDVSLHLYSILIQYLNLKDIVHLYSINTQLSTYRSSRITCSRDYRIVCGAVAKGSSDQLRGYYLLRGIFRDWICELKNRHDIEELCKLTLHVLQEPRRPTPTSLHQTIYCYRNWVRMKRVYERELVSYCWAKAFITQFKKCTANINTWITTNKNRTYFEVSFTQLWKHAALTYFPKSSDGYTSPKCDYYDCIPCHNCRTRESYFKSAFFYGKYIKPVFRFIVL